MHLHLCHKTFRLNVIALTTSPPKPVSVFLFFFNAHAADTVLRFNATTLLLLCNFFPPNTEFTCHYENTQTSRCKCRLNCTVKTFTTNLFYNIRTIKTSLLFIYAQLFQQNPLSFIIFIFKFNLSWEVGLPVKKLFSPSLVKTIKILYLLVISTF